MPHDGLALARVTGFAVKAKIGKQAPHGVCRRGIAGNAQIAALRLFRFLRFTSDGQRPRPPDDCQLWRAWVAAEMIHQLGA